MATLTIAACQYAPVLGDLAGNRALALTWVERAAARGAELVVLPELGSSGYAFESEAQASDSAETSTGAFVAMLTQACAEHKLHVVTGLNERDGACRYNSAVCVGPQGVIATYRKTHLFYNEKSWFVPGTGMVVIDFPWGKLGIEVCYDLWFPEVARSLALAGADVIAVPTNWVGNFKPRVREGGYIQGNVVAMATAAQNAVVMACADRTGVEGDVNFLGNSIIVGADGWPVAGPASPADDELLVATIDIEAGRAALNRTPRNHLRDDRNVEAYGVVTVVSAGA